MALENPPTWLFTIGSYGSGPGQFGLPHGLAVNAAGHLYVADAGYHRVEEFASDGTFIRMWGTYGTDPGQFSTPWNVLAARSGYVYVAERDNSRVQKFTADGTFVGILGPQGTGDGQFARPWGLAEDDAGNIYVADTGWRIQKFSPLGAFIQMFASPGAGPGQTWDQGGMAFGSGPTLHVAQGAIPRVVLFTTDGQFLSSWPYPLNGWCCARGIAIDHGGNVSMALGNDILKLSSSGTLLARWGGWGTAHGKFDTAIGVAIDGNGDLYIADAINRRVEKFSGSSVVPTRRTTWGRIKQVYR